VFAQQLNKQSSNELRTTSAQMLTAIRMVSQAMLKNCLPLNFTPQRLHLFQYTTNLLLLNLGILILPPSASCTRLFQLLPKLDAAASAAAAGDAFLAFAAGRALIVAAGRFAAGRALIVAAGRALIVAFLAGRCAAGRALIVAAGRVAVFNVFCPRLSYKMHFVISEQKTSVMCCAVFDYRYMCV
jgi:hypothetical protein